MDMLTFVKEFGVQTLVVALAVLCGTVVLIPVSLRIAGLTGQQIADTIGLTLQMFIALVKEFRAQNNKSNS